MSQGITITHSESEAGGRYEARVDGKDGTGELTYSRVSPTRIIANHTGVDERLRGTGVASALVERLVADARSRGITIVPRCSYVVAQCRRNPDWSDVMEG
jgi:predicted GNAT family acetyltransferase